MPSSAFTTLSTGVKFTKRNAALVVGRLARLKPPTTTTRADSPSPGSASPATARTTRPIQSHSFETAIYARHGAIDFPGDKGFHEDIYYVRCRVCREGREFRFYRLKGIPKDAIKWQEDHSCDFNN